MNPAWGKFNLIAVKQKKTTSSSSMDLSGNSVIKTMGLIQIHLAITLFTMERVLDNLLNNATKAISGEGGRLTINYFKKGKIAFVAVTNTGLVPTRGLNIITRFAQTYYGKLQIEWNGDETIVTIMLPLHQQ